MSNLDPDPDRRDILEAFNARHRNLIQQEGFIHVRITEEKLISLHSSRQKSCSLVHSILNISGRNDICFVKHIFYLNLTEPRLKEP